MRRGGITQVIQRAGEIRPPACLLQASPIRQLALARSATVDARQRSARRRGPPRHSLATCMHFGPRTRLPFSLDDDAPSPPPIEKHGIFARSNNPPGIGSEGALRLFSQSYSLRENDCRCSGHLVLASSPATAMLGLNPSMW